jgi:lysophospholipase L1-like esterase
MIAIIYFVLLHLALVLFFLKPNFLVRLYRKLKIQKGPANEHEYYMETQWEYFSIKSKTLKKNSDQFVFLGDSLITVLCVENLFNGVNFGVSAENLKRAKEKISTISNLENKNIVLTYGINDILSKSTTIYSDYINLINSLPESSTIFIFSILPVDEKVVTRKIKSSNLNDQVKHLNALLREYVKSNDRIHFLDTAKYLYNESGELNKNLHKGDGIHLNELGNRLWIKGIKKEIMSQQIKN